jgi:hypothetical protein
MEWEVKEKRIKEKGKEIDFKTKMNRSGVWKLFFGAFWYIQPGVQWGFFVSQNQIPIHLKEHRIQLWLEELESQVRNHQPCTVIYSSFYNPNPKDLVISLPFYSRESQNACHSLAAKLCHSLAGLENISHRRISNRKTSLNKSCHLPSPPLLVSIHFIRVDQGCLFQLVASCLHVYCGPGSKRVIYACLF